MFGKAFKMFPGPPKILSESEIISLSQGIYGGVSASENNLSLSLSVLSVINSSDNPIKAQKEVEEMLGRVVLTMAPRDVLGKKLQTLDKIKADLTSGLQNYKDKSLHEEAGRDPESESESAYAKVVISERSPQIPSDVNKTIYSDVKPVCSSDNEDMSLCLSHYQDINDLEGDSCGASGFTDPSAASQQAPKHKPNPNDVYAGMDKVNRNVRKRIPGTADLFKHEHEPEFEKNKELRKSNKAEKNVSSSRDTTDKIKMAWAAQEIELEPEPVNENINEKRAPQPYPRPGKKLIQSAIEKSTFLFPVPIPAPRRLLPASQAPQFTASSSPPRTESPTPASSSLPRLSPELKQKPPPSPSLMPKASPSPSPSSSSKVPPPVAKKPAKQPK